MKELPVVIFTKNRTGCAVATVKALMKNLRHTGYDLRYIVCDDRSEPGHIEAILKVFRDYGIEPTVHVANFRRNNLGAVMNMGLQDAFRTSDRCFRLEDDWLLKCVFDIGPMADALNDPDVCCVRLGATCRDDKEMAKYGNGRFLRFITGEPAKKRFFYFNNQLAVVSRSIHEKLGFYPENVTASKVERYMASKYNGLTSNCSKPPYVLWPAGFARNRMYEESLPFAHIGESLVGHKGTYKIPEQYKKYNSPREVERLRREALELMIPFTAPVQADIEA